MENQIQWSDVLSVMAILSTFILGFLQVRNDARRAKTAEVGEKNEETASIAEAADKIASASTATINNMVKRLEYLETQVARIPTLEKEVARIPELERMNRQLSLDLEFSKSKERLLTERVRELEEKIRVMEQNGNPPTIPPAQA